jgi:hypothetical protein
MTARDERFVSNSASLVGTITRFEVVRHELIETRQAIVLTVVVGWRLVERADSTGDTAMSTTWRVMICDQRRDGACVVLAVANSTTGAVHHERTAAGDEHRFELQMSLELPADSPGPRLEAVIRREENVARSPSGDVLGYIENPDLDPDLERATPDVGQWLHGELDSLRSLFIPQPRRTTRSEPDAIDSHQPNVAPSASLADARVAVYAPSHVERGKRFILDVWAFRPDLHNLVAQEATRQGRAHLLGTKGPLPLAVGRTLAVSVSIPSFHVDPPLDVVVWDGTRANTSFTVCALPAALAGPHIGCATVSSGDVPVAVVHFELVVADRETESRRGLDDDAIRIRSIFASYASADRVEVLQWARGAEVAGVHVFLDVLSLRESTDWETALVRHVPAKDLFCLFWSAPASESRWVDMEWRCALAARGLDYIHPVALADPRIVPPPDALRSKHFSSVSFAVREYEKRIGHGGS